MDRQASAVVPPARVLPSRQVRAGAQPQPVSKGMLILAPRPQGGADPGGRLFLRGGEVEGQLDTVEVDVDDLLVGAAADVAVRQQRRTHVHRPATARPNLDQEALHVGLDRIRHLPRKHALEMAAREGVLSLVEERPREFQAHAHQLGLVDQYREQGGNGLVQQRIAIRFPGAAHSRRLHRGHTEEKPYVRVLGMAAGERAQYLERLVWPASIEQRPGHGGAVIGWQPAFGRDRRVDREQEKGGSQPAAKAFEGRRHSGMPAWGEKGTEDRRLYPSRQCR